VFCGKAIVMMISAPTDYREVARRSVPRLVFDYIAGGANVDDRSAEGEPSARFSWADASSQPYIDHALSIPTFTRFKQWSPHACDRKGDALANG
jgi:hypothetical protein